MFWDVYAPYLIRAFDALCGLIALVAAVIFVASLIDILLKLGWGYDPDNLWIAPAVMIGAGLVHKIGGAIFRLVEAIAND